MYVSSMTTTRTASPVIGKCRNGHTVKATSDDVRAGWITCGCGAQAVAKFMTVKVNAAKVCNGVCMGATGASCDCSCGGENHGSNHTHEAA